MKGLFLFLVGVVGQFGVPLSGPLATRAKPINLVFIAGPNDHCGDNPCHQYAQDLGYLKTCLETSGRYAVRLYVGERPPVGSLDDVAAVVVHSSADRTLKEWHGLFPQNQNPDGYNADDRAFLADLETQLQRGMGLMVMHYATWVDHPEAQKRLFDWIGGYYRKGQSKVDGDASTPGTTAPERIEPTGTNHPILNGVQTWTLEDEYYFNLHLNETAPRYTPLLKSALPLNGPAPHVVAWCLERPGGGRGVGFTGGHFHKSLRDVAYRTFVLNAIVWVAKGRVPPRGIHVSLSTPDVP
jgi:type 1 glutamine amidotransferase